MGNPPLEFIKIQPLKRGSASKIHQHTVPQKGDRLQNSSTYTAIKGGPPLELINQRGSTSRFHHLDPPLEFINVQPQNRGSASRIHQHTAPQKGSASRIHQHTAPQKGVRIQNSSSYSPPKGGPHLEFINIQPPKRGSASRIHQHTVPPPPKKRGSAALESINQMGFNSRIHQPKGVRLQILSTKRGSASNFINKKGFHLPKRDNLYGSSTVELCTVEKFKFSQIFLVDNNPTSLCSKNISTLTILIIF